MILTKTDYEIKFENLFHTHFTTIHILPENINFYTTHRNEVQMIIK